MSEDAPMARARAAIAIRRFDEAARHAGLAIAASPEHPDGYYLLAFALHNLDRNEEALKEFDGAYSEEELRLMRLKFMSEVAN